MRRFKIAKQKRQTLGKHRTELARSSTQIAHTKCSCGHGTRISWWWPWCVVIVTAAVRIRYVMLPENWWILHPDEIFQSIEKFQCCPARITFRAESTHQCCFQGCYNCNKAWWFAGTQECSTVPQDIWNIVEIRIAVAFSEVYGYGFRPYEYLPAPENTSIPTDAQMFKSGMYGLRSSLYPRMFMIALRVAKVIGLDQSPFMICRVFNAAFTSLLPVTVYWLVLRLFHCRLLAFLTCALCASEYHLTVFGTHTIVNSFISPVLFLGLTLCLQRTENSRKMKDECKDTINKESDQNANIISKHSNENGLNLYKELQQISPNNKDINTSNHANYVKIQRTEAKFRFITTENICFIMKLFGGFLLGIVCYVRPDTILFCVCVIFPAMYSKRQLDLQHVKELSPSVLGGALAFMFCAADDWSWYGWGIISPVQWFKFNLLSGKASKLFGTKSTHMYLNFFNGRLEYIAVNLSMLTILIYSRLRQRDCLLLPREFCAICFSFIFNILAFSSAGHKENRFIHNVIVLFILIYTYSIHTLLSLLRKLFPKKAHSSLIPTGILTASIILSYNHFPSISESSISEWTYGDARDSADVNTCLDWVQRRYDVSGVLVDASLYDTAGFTILKHDVPLLVKMHNEFYLFDISRTNRRERKSGRLRLIRNYSDFIHQTNKVYLTKLIFRDKTFNYVITKSDVFSFLNSKYVYRKVFTHGQYNVFHRNFSTSEENDLERLSGTLPVGDNATVLEYEANWLITNALYHLAIERAETAMKIDRPRVRLYQQMFVCYSRLNDMKQLYHYQEECFRKFGQDACVKQHEKIVLHEHYNRFD